MNFTTCVGLSNPTGLVRELRVTSVDIDLCYTTVGRVGIVLPLQSRSIKLRIVLYRIVQYSNRKPLWRMIETSSCAVAQVDGWIMLSKI